MKQKEDDVSNVEYKSELSPNVMKDIKKINFVNRRNRHQEWINKIKMVEEILREAAYQCYLIRGDIVFEMSLTGTNNQNQKGNKMKKTATKKAKKAIATKSTAKKSTKKSTKSPAKKGK